MTSRNGDGPFPDGGSLPPELNPRGRRAGRAEQRAASNPNAAAGAPQASYQPRVGRAQARRNARSVGAEVRRGVALGTMTISALLSIAIVLGSGYAWYAWKGLNGNIQRVNAIPALSSGSNTTTDVDGTDQNILIVGNDDRDSATDAELAQLGTTRDGGSYNTDTMMILHAPANGKSATVISLPRDSWVSIPGHGMGKLNSAYPDGVVAAKGDKGAGAQLLITTIQNLTGLHIDHYVQVDLIGFFRISNAIGGVTVNMCKAVKDSYSGINLPAGQSTISGSQALAFVRQRHGLNGGDFDRIKRQQYFITAAFSKISSAGTLLNPFTLNKLISAVTSSVTTDESLQLVKLAGQFQKLGAGSINSVTIPNNGTGTISGQSVVLVTPATVKSFALALVAPQATPTPAPTAGGSAISPEDVALDVLNAGAANGAAATAGTALGALGYHVVDVSSAKTTLNKTTVMYAASADKSAADLVASAVPGATVQQSSTVSAITLYLGSDNLTVGGSTSTATPAPTVTPNAAATGACIN